MKNILIVTISHKARDVRLYYKLSKTLTKRYAVTILHNNADMSDYDEDIKLIGLNKLSRVRFLLQAAIQIKFLAPAVVIVVEPILLSLVNSLTHTKYVYDCHEFFNLAQREKSLNKRKQYLDTLLHDRLEKFFVPQLTACITVNDILSNHYEQLGTRSLTIPNYPVSNRLEIDSEEKIYDFIYAGGLSPTRGIREIIQATFMVSKVYPQVKVLLVGKEQITHFRAECAELIATLCLEKNVELIDAIPYDQVYQRYAQARCGICILSPEAPRHKYALPIKLLEYLDAGLLVITNDFPINKQIYNKSDGIFTTVFAPEAIANQMLKVITMKDEAVAKHQQVAYDLINDKYNWSLLENKLLDLFADITSSNKRALLISYFFPPLGGAGVQRPLKIAKYANESNWEVDVLTIDDIVFHSYDPSLLAEIDNEVIRADSWDVMSLLNKIKQITLPSMGEKVDKAYFETNDFKKKLVKSLFFMDEKIGWFIPAILKGIRQILKKEYSAIIVTIYPPSSLLIAYVLAKITNLPFFIDYRDHWTLSTYFDFSCDKSRQAYHHLENFFLTNSRGVITIGEVMKQELQESFELAAEKVTVAYNGFDESDFTTPSAIPEKSSASQYPEAEIINIGYIGNMYKHRTSKYFLTALQELIAEQEIDRTKIRVNFMGNYYLEELNVIHNSSLQDLITITPQQEHKIAIEAMQNSDILLLLIDTESGKNVLTGKIFEYLRCNRPILGLVPEGGEAELLLTNLGNPWSSQLENVQAVKVQLKSIYDFVRKGGKVEFDIAEYSRSQQVKKLFSFIEGKV
ncbi:MAG: glycosyltransferase [Candidatus Cloacimonadales bacterium]